MLLMYSELSFEQIPMVINTWHFYNATQKGKHQIKMVAAHYFKIDPIFLIDRRNLENKLLLSY